MKASKNSIHAKLYDFTYSGGLPQNLCPYFWKLIFSAIMFVPNFIVQAPSLIINLFQKHNNDCAENRLNGLAVYVCGAILTLLSIVEFQYFKAVFGAYSYDKFSANCGLIINVMILFILFRWLWIEYVQYWFKKKRTYEEPKPNIVVEFVKAKYNKYCPKIDWK